MTTQPTGVSVTLPVGQAIDRVKRVLFQPFDIGKWFIIGFCAWLASLGEGGGFHGNFNFSNHHDSHELRHAFEQARDFVMTNLFWIVPLVIGLILVSVVLWLVFLWLSSRGRFMFLHCVALNTAEVQVPWTTFAREANSLFLFRLVMSLIGFVITLPLVVGLVLAVMRMVCRQAIDPLGILVAIALLAALILVAIGFWIIWRLTKDFVVPIQFLRRSRCLEAWREFRLLMRGNIGNLILYFLFRLVLAVVIGILGVMVVLMTCCVAGCLAALPYFGTVFMLPLLVFDLAFSLHYLAQFGPRYDVFAPRVAAPPVGS